MPDDPFPDFSEPSPEVPYNFRPRLRPWPADPRRDTRASALWLLMRGGDPAARGVLRDLALETLSPHVMLMIGHLCAHARLCDPSARPESASLSKKLAVEFNAGVEDATSTWDGEGDWLDHSAVAGCNAIWREVAPVFKAEALVIVRKTLAKFDAPVGVLPVLTRRIPDVLESICSEAVDLWLMLPKSRPDWPNWPVFASARADFHFQKICVSLVPERTGWEQIRVLERRIIGLANWFTKSRFGYVHEPLRDELASVARFFVARAVVAAGEGQQPSVPFLMKVAKNAMLGILSVRRSHNYDAIWWMIQVAIEEFRERKGRDPELEEIAEALDPKWAQRKRKRPNFPPSLIAKVISMFSFVPDEGIDPAASAAAAAVLEELIIRARLDNEEKQVWQLRLEAVSHDDIAVQLDISPAKSRKVYHNAFHKLCAVAKNITDEEWAVLNWRIAEERSPGEIEKLAGIPERDGHVLFHFAREQLSMFPHLHTRLTQREWGALDRALSGMRHAEIAALMRISRNEAAALLKSGIWKIPRPATELSKNEIKALALYTAGRTHDEIAAKLRITPTKSRRWLHKAFEKLFGAGEGLGWEARKVLQLRVADGKSDIEIAFLLGIPARESRALFHFAREQLATFPCLHADLTQREWQALELALAWIPQAEIATRMNLPCDDIARLLKDGAAKLLRPAHEEKSR